MDTEADDGLRTKIPVSRLTLLGLTTIVGIACIVVPSVSKWPHIWIQSLVGCGAALIAGSLIGLLAGYTNAYAQKLLRAGVADTFAQRQRSLSDEKWQEMIAKAQNHVRVLGGANHGYIGRDGAKWDRIFETAFAHAVARGVRVEVLWPNLDSEEAVVAERDEGRQLRIDALDSILCFGKLHRVLASGEPKSGSLELKEYTAMVSCGLTWIDDVLIVSHYLPRTPHLECPGLVLRTSPRFFASINQWWRVRDFGLARAYTQMYEGLTDHKVATLINEARLEELEGRRASYRSTYRSEVDMRKDGSDETPSPPYNGKDDPNDSN